MKKVAQNHNPFELSRDITLTLLNNIGAGISLVDRDMRIVWVNEELERWFGPLEKIKGSHCYSTYQKKKRICEGCPTYKSFKSGKVEQAIQSGITISDEERSYLLTTTPIKDDKGDITLVLELTQDITEKLNLEEELKKMACAVNSMREMVTITNLSGSILYVNPQTEKIFGYEARELIGQNVSVMHSKNNPQGLSKKIFDATLKGGWEGEVLNVKKSAEEFIVHLITSTVKDASGKTIALVGVSQDISKLKANENALKNSNTQLQSANRELILRTRELKSTWKKIKSLNLNLERRVERRTRELRLANKELMTIFEVSKGIISTLNLQEVLDMIAKMTCVIIDTHACTLRLFDSQTNKLIPSASFGITKKYLERTPQVIGEGVAGLIAKLKEPINIYNTERDERVKYSDLLCKEGFRSVLGVPIQFKNELLGVIITYNLTKRRFKEEEIRLLSTFATQAAIAINNAKLHNKIHVDYLNMINTLILAIEAKDPYSRGHSERVSKLAVLIARKMKLHDEHIEILRHLGRIHDIGKLAISDAILNKPDTLSIKERAEIELHPVKGAELLSQIDFFSPYISLIKHHHERFDGQGYPGGLKKDDIPLFDRIISVADSFDAMTSDRPYRKSLTVEEALLELERNSGSQFDPEITRILIDLIKKEQISKERKNTSLFVPPIESAV